MTAGRFRAVAARLLVATVIVGGCAPASAAPGASSPSPDLTVFAAASLADALDRVALAWSSETGGRLVISTDSSAALRTQIEQGAPADVFLSADTINPRALAEAGLTDGRPVPFAANRLTIIIPADNPAAIDAPADLARPGVQIVAAGDAVPITRYAAQVVTALATLPAQPVGFADAYAANVVSREDNVKAMVAKIALGEGDAGIVYETDAAVEAGVETVAIPPGANVTAVYEGVVVDASTRRTDGRAFLEWLTGAEGRAILTDAGFLPPPA